MINIIKMTNKLKCLKCKYKWKPRTKEVKTCPRCKSYTWNKEKVRKEITNIWDTKIKKKKVINKKEESIYVEGKSWGEQMEKLDN